MQYYPIFLAMVFAAYFFHMVSFFLLHICYKICKIKKTEYDKINSFLNVFCLFIIVLIFASFFILVGYTFPYSTLSQ